MFLAALNAVSVKQRENWGLLSLLVRGRVGSECKRYFNSIGRAGFIAFDGKLRHPLICRASVLKADGNGKLVSENPVFLKRSLAKFVPTTLPPPDQSLLSLGGTRKISVEAKPAKKASKKKVSSKSITSTKKTTTSTKKTTSKKTSSCKNMSTPSTPTPPKPSASKSGQPKTQGSKKPVSKKRLPAERIASRDLVDELTYVPPIPSSHPGKAKSDNYSFQTNIFSDIELPRLSSSAKFKLVPCLLPLTPASKDGLSKKKDTTPACAALPSQAEDKGCLPMQKSSRIKLKNRRRKNANKKKDTSSSNTVSRKPSNLGSVIKTKDQETIADLMTPGNGSDALHLLKAPPQSNGDMNHSPPSHNDSTLRQPLSSINAPGSSHAMLNRLNDSQSVTSQLNNEKVDKMSTLMRRGQPSRHLQGVLQSSLKFPSIVSPARGSNESTESSMGENSSMPVSKQVSKKLSILSSTKKKRVGSRVKTVRFARGVTTIPVIPSAHSTPSHSTDIASKEQSILEESVQTELTSMYSETYSDDASADDVLLDMVGIEPDPFEDSDCFTCTDVIEAPVKTPYKGGSVKRVSALSRQVRASISMQMNPDDDEPPHKQRKTDIGQVQRASPLALEGSHFRIEGQQEKKQALCSSLYKKRQHISSRCSPYECSESNCHEAAVEAPPISEQIPERVEQTRWMLLLFCEVVDKTGTRLGHDKERSRLASIFQEKVERIQLEESRLAEKLSGTSAAVLLRRISEPDGTPDSHKKVSYRMGCLEPAWASLAEDFIVRVKEMDQRQTHELYALKAIEGRLDL